MTSLGKVAAVVVLGVVPVACRTPHPPPSHPGPPQVGCAAIEPSPAGELPPPATPPPSSGTTRSDAVTVDLRDEVGPTNEGLLGWVWNSGSTIQPLAPIGPSMIRLDAGLQSASRGPGDLDLSGLLARVAEVRSVGAEPLVLMSYMPRWLGEPNADGRDPSRVAPYDFDLWQEVVEQTVRTLATAEQPAYRFEVWNEPDIFIFWDDTPENFAEMAVRTHRAVAEVEAETGLPLEVGGPALAFGTGQILGIPFPDVFTPYVTRVVEEGLPLDFISWHHYANSPFLGPDGAEGNLDDPLYEALKGRNPDMTPLDFSEDVAAVRARTEPLLAGTGLDPTYMLNEWNVSAGGYDLRHDSAEGAALVAGTLVEMERVGLEEAGFYRAITGGDNRPGDWGMVTPAGTPKPSWWVYRAWRAAEGARLQASGDDAATGLWARATRADDGRCVSVLLSNFVATGSPTRTVTVTLDGPLPACRGPRLATVDTLDSRSTTLSDPAPVRLDRHRQATVTMEPQSVALLRVGCGGP